MKHRALRPTGWLVGSAGALAAAALVAAPLISTGAPASASQGTHARPSHARITRPQVSALAGQSSASKKYPVTPFTQEFQTSTSGFCPAHTKNAPCNGGINNYGTISRVLSRFSNGGAGNYAPSTKALVGGWMALTSGTQAINQGKGCPNPGTEYCSGPYALFGTGAAMGVENVFPKSGFTVTDDLYLSPTTAAPAGALVDDDVELNLSSGAYGIDNVITACPQTGGFVINFGNNSPGSCAGTPLVTKNGWYRFVFIFSDVAGDAYVTERVLTEPTATQPKPKLIAGTAAQPVGGTAQSISKWGGPGYFWLPTEDISGLPLANFALQLGQVGHGHTP